MGTLAKGYTFGATETVTNAKLHSLIDSGTISGIVNADVSAGAAIAESKLSLDGTSAVLITGAQSIAGLKTFSGGVTSTGALILSSTLNFGTTNQGDVLYDDGTNINRLTPGTSGKYLKTQGTTANPKWDSVSTEDYVVKAWANVTYSGGTPTLADSYNVTSITDTGTGQLTVTWATDFANTNYAVVATTENSTDSLFTGIKTKATGSVLIQVQNHAGSAADPNVGISVIAIGDQA